MTTPSTNKITIPDSTHNWYDFVYSYDPQLIHTLIDELNITTNDLVYDPFTGTGTTVLTCKQHGIDAIGTDTSPASTLSATVKTTWNINIDAFSTRKEKLLNTLRPALKSVTATNRTTLQDYTNSSPDPPLPLTAYNFTKPQTLPEGWLHELTRKHATVIKHHINQQPDDAITDAFRLALIAILPESLANIRFAPEVTRNKDTPPHIDAYTPFKNKITQIQTDLRKITRENNCTQISPGTTSIHCTDARNASDLIMDKNQLFERHGSINYVITSPPYPSEHDYTRNQRLELLFLDHCRTTTELQSLKKQNIRSHTKNVYADDSAGENVNIHDNTKVHEIVTEMEKIITQENITHGFGQTYPRVVEEYFGGMVHHLQDTATILSESGSAAYVVADSGSYWQVEIPTSEILGELAVNKTPFSSSKTKHWRDITTTTADYDTIPEKILILTK